MPAKKRKSPTEPRRFLRGQMEALIRRAVEIAKPKGREVCGLLVDNGSLLELVPMRSQTKAPGSFALSMKRVRRAEKAARLIGHRVVGTYHSHPVSPAEPGRSDIVGADEGAFMLIVSCWDWNAKLWRIHKGKAKEVAYSLIEG